MIAAGNAPLAFFFGVIIGLIIASLIAYSAEREP